MRKALVQRAALVVLILASLAGCRREVYLVPHGYTGPVVVIYECPAGEPIDTDSRVIIFPIETNGTLLVDGERPPSGWVDMNVHWVDHGGHRTPLPYNRRQSEGENLHAFGLSVGFTRTASGEEFPHTTFWIEQPDADLEGRLRDALMEEAQARCRS